MRNIPDEEESNLDEALEILLFAYIASLSKAALKTQMSSSLEAVGELNSVRGSVGLEPVKIPAKALSKESIISAANYEKLLKDRGGSYVVETVGTTEKKVFKHWLKDLKSDTRESVLQIMKSAKNEGWTAERIDSEFRKLEEFAVKKRARVAAFTETRNMQYEAQIRTWKSGELEYVQRHAMHKAATCGVCADLDRRVFLIQDALPLSHPNCLCYYTPYITKDAKY